MKKLLLTTVLHVLILFSSYTITNHIYDEMQKKSNEIMRKILHISDIDWQEIQKQLAKQKALYSVPRTTYNHDKNIPKKILEKICSLLKQYGIEPTSIDITATTIKNETSYAAVNGISLFVNVNNMSKLPENQFNFVLAHEVGHLLQAHPLLDAIVLDHVETLTNNFNEEEKNTYYKKYWSWIRKNEIIADQYIISKQGFSHLIQSGLDLFKNFLKQEGNHKSRTHPCYKKRILSIVENLVQPQKELHYLLNEQVA